MAKTKISEFSTTAGNNTDINSINIAEGCAPSGINDAIRELMRQLKEFQTGGAGDSVNSGGDFSVATNKFTVASASGNTSVAGTLGVTGTTTLTGALVANGNATLGDASGDTVTIKGTPTLEVNPTLSGGTANGVLYLNGSKVATSGSALTFDGSSLTVFGGGAIKGNKNASGQFLAFVAQNSTQNYGTYIDQDNAGSNSWSLFDTTNSQTALRYYPSTSGYWQFYVNNSEAMRLTSTGLGIGTSSPAYKLDVNGSASATSGVFGGTGATNITIGSGGIYNGFVSNSSVYLVSDGGSASGIIAYGSTHATKPSILEIRSGSAVRATLNSSGNLGLGVTPSAWTNSFGVIQGLGGWSISHNGANSNSVDFLSNAYRSGGANTYLYIESANATRYQQLAGVHAWYTAASGTAGNAITFTQALTLDASGNLLCGNTSLPTSYGAASGVINTTGGVWTNRGQFTATGGSTTTFLTLANASNNQSYIVSVRQSGAGGNFVSAFVVAYGSNASAIRFSQDNTNPVLDMNITNSGLDIKLVLAAGFGSTTWDWVITRLG